jgi:D-sedoheptulose 7-phosphate isomerase
MQDTILNALTDAQRYLDLFTRDAQNIRKIAEIAKTIAECYRNRGKVIIFGNGGSMCDAMHFAEELTGRFHQDRAALPAIALSDPSHITCVANDFGFDQVFARGVQAYAIPGDVVIGISTSGNSPNVINAIHQAQSMNCTTIALLGGDGGKLGKTMENKIIIPAKTSDRVQEIHTLILHVLVQLVEQELFFPKVTEPNYA